MKILSLRTPKSPRFGTDGWRGVISEEFTFANLERVTQAYADYLINIHHLNSNNPPNSPHEITCSAPVIIGYDGRFLSKEFAYRTAEVLAGNQLDSEIFCEPVPTPLVSWAVRQKNAAGGIIITASHNPAEFNGFKIKSKWGASASNEITTAVESFIDLQPPKRAPFSKPTDSEFTENIFESYRQQIFNYVDLDKICASENRVIIDSMHGVGGYWLEKFLHRGGMQPETIRGTRDPLFGGGQPEPIDRNLIELKKRVLETQAMLGLATDGDADRFGVIDERGESITMHDIVPILMIHMIRRKGMTGGIVRTFSQSSLIKRIADAHNLRLYDVPIGFKYIADLMIKENILIGVEESGGVGVQGHLPERDGILNSLLLLEAVTTLKSSPSKIVKEIHREFGEFYFESCNLKADVNIGQSFVARLAQNPPTEIANQTVSDVEILDGTKLIFADDSWLLFRQSGTEQLLRIYSEATSKSKTRDFIEAGKTMALSEIKNISKG